jgi:hypothetical protein
VFFVLPIARALVASADEVKPPIATTTAQSAANASVASLRRLDMWAV